MTKRSESIAYPQYGRAFTLIELLVVISIIALLMAILVPTLSLAKERAKRIVCANNIHQFMIGIDVYTKQNDEYLPEPGKPWRGHAIT